MPLDLNPSQKHAVTCPLKPTIVIAGPGSGKTHVIINRIHYMLQQLNCDPQHILVVTFSKLAANEMKERFIKQYRESRVHFGTLHSIFYKILKSSDPQKYHSSNLLLESEKKTIIQNLFLKLESDEYEDFVEEFLKHLALMQNQLINPKYYYPDGLSKEIFLKLFQEYEYYKEVHHKFDFDDMLVHCYYLLLNDQTLLNAVRNYYRYLLVDEFQDINLVQFEIIKLLTKKHENLFVVGDDDQSIYKFRGAKPEFLLDFKNHFPNTQQIFLDVNYRSTKNILNYSLALITHNKNRYVKALTTPNEIGHIPKVTYCKDSKEQSELILNQIITLKNQGEKLRDLAVIYRTNLQARPVVEILLTANLSFCLRDGMITLYDQWVTQDILAYLHLASDMTNSELALKIINKPKRYISKAIAEKACRLPGTFFANLLTFDEVTEWQKNYIQQLLFDLQILREKSLQDAILYIRKNIGYDQYILDYTSYRKIPPTTLYEVLDELQESAIAFKNYTDWEAFLIDISKKIKEQTSQQALQQDSITLTTMHGAKGLEFKEVFIIDVIEGSIPHHKSSSEVEAEEERRLFYVAMTRAKNNLYLYIPSEKYGKPVNPSLFIEDLTAHSLKVHVQKNKFLVHKKLGRGEILEILDDGILKVKFDVDNIRKIDGNYCINNGIIQWEE
ncbi:MAG: UvrD/REP helicase [Clostridia bacterium]|nr:UvrD/REP helicase [Clostridia bacterium]